MPEQDGLNAAERELEDALKALTPAAARVDAVSAAYKAGRRAARRQVYLWRGATAAVVLIALSAAIIPTGSDSRTTQSEVVQVPAAVVQPMAAQSVVMLQAAFHEQGMAGLPATDLPPVDVKRSGDWL
jgi:uncharacterized membrane protein YoaK (UPF0700 family)